MACEGFSLKEYFKEDTPVTFWWQEKDNTNIAYKLLNFMEENTNCKFGSTNKPTDNVHVFEKNKYHILLLDYKQRLGFAAFSSKEQMMGGFVEYKKEVGLFKDAIEIKSSEEIY